MYRPRALDLIEKLKEKGIKCIRLKHEEEAMCERASVAYAADALGLTDVCGTLGSGGGSTQFVHGGCAYKADKTGYRKGAELMRKAAIEDREDFNPIDALDLWCKEVMHPDVDKELYDRLADCEPGEGDQGDQGACSKKKKLKGTVVCISACYFASSYVGVGMENGKAEVRVASDRLCAMPRLLSFRFRRRTPGRQGVRALACDPIVTDYARCMSTFMRLHRSRLTKLRTSSRR